MNSVVDWTSTESVSKHLAEQERALGASSVEVADICVKLADLLFIEEDFVKAEQLYWRALGVRQKALGEWHEDTAAVLQNLAELYEIQDRYAEAQRFYQWSVSAKKSAMLKRHSDKLDRTVQTKTLVPKLPQMDQMQSKCSVCGRQKLDSVVCLYCTQDGFDAMGLLNKLMAEQEESAHRHRGPVNVLESVDGQIQYDLDETSIRIGRHPSNTIVLSADKNVSRHHATIEFASGEFVIKDSGSANGTFVNQQKLSGPTTLRPGDFVTIGKTTLRAGFKSEA